MDEEKEVKPVDILKLMTGNEWMKFSDFCVRTDYICRISTLVSEYL